MAVSLGGFFILRWSLFIAPRGYSQVSSLNKVGLVETQKGGDLFMSCLDHLLPFIDNGGRRLYIERRRDSKIAGRIPERRTKERRINYDRRKTQNTGELRVKERRAFISK
jgi:hypothetical protein